VIYSGCKNVLLALPILCILSKYVRRTIGIPHICKPLMTPIRASLICDGVLNEAEAQANTLPDLRVRQMGLA
jgi:hypothetical protein